MATQPQPDARPTPPKRTRLIIDISPELRRRIKVAAAQKDMTIRQYVEQTLEQITKDQTREQEPERKAKPVSRNIVEELLAFRENFAHQHPGVVFEDSVELLRQIREERDRYLEDLHKQ